MREIDPGFLSQLQNRVFIPQIANDTGIFDFYGITPTGDPNKEDYGRLDNRPYGASYFWDMNNETNDPSTGNPGIIRDPKGDTPFGELFGPSRYSDLSERLDDWDEDSLLKSKNSSRKLTEAYQQAKAPAMTDNEFLDLGLQKIREYQPSFPWGQDAAALAKLKKLGKEYQYSKTNHGSGLMPEGPWSYEPEGYRDRPVRTRSITPENSRKLFELAMGNLAGTPIYVDGKDIANYYGKWASYPYSQ